MLKNAPRVMAIVLLVAIAALMVIAGGSGFTELFKGVEAHTDDPIDPNTNTEPPSVTPETPEDIPPFLSSKFPKQPCESDLFAYTQSIETDSGLKLEAVHQTAQGNLLVISGAPVSGDFTVERNSVTVINMSCDGTLNKCLTLSVSTPTYYVCSQLTSEGLAVAVKDNDKCFIYTMDYALSGSSFAEMDTVNAARIFPLSQGYMFLAERAENTVYLIRGGTVHKSAIIQAGNVLEIMEMRSVLTLFINGINGYSVLSLDKNLEGFSQINIPEKHALKVLPVTENGVQKFLVVEFHCGSIYLSKHSATFREADCERVGIGLADGADIYQNGDSVFLLLKGTNPRVYLVDMQLNFTLSSSEFYHDIKDIYACDGYNGGYLMLSCNGDTDSLTLTDIRNDGSVSTKTIAVAADNAEFVRNLNNTVSIIYTSDQNPNMVSIAGITL
ncbi:MAG: hypothetical protein PHI19_01540 [Clostridia bacterium]|nr:hypothetical protein [Clostridia bacterium]